MKALPVKQAQKNWVQTERSSHEAWVSLITKNANAAKIMHLLVARIGDHNAVVIGQKTLAKLASCSERTVRNALTILVADKWIEIRQIGQNGTVNAYIINDRVAWVRARDGLRYSLFSANVIISEDEQPDRELIDHQEPLRKLPRIGELQVPTGDGLPPPSQPFLPDMEPELPSAGTDQSERAIELRRSED